MNMSNIASIGSQEIRINKSFECSSQKIYEALTNSELIQQWYKAPHNWIMAICDIDLKVGGEYKYLWFIPSFPQGYLPGMYVGRFYEGSNEVSIFGIFNEIIPNKKLVYTEDYNERWYPGECVNTIILTETGAGCELVQTLKFDSQEARDIVLNSGLEESMDARFLRIAEVASKV